MSAESTVSTYANPAGESIMVAEMELGQMGVEVLATFLSAAAAEQFRQWLMTFAFAEGGDAH